MYGKLCLHPKAVAKQYTNKGIGSVLQARVPTVKVIGKHMHTHTGTCIPVKVIEHVSPCYVMDELNNVRTRA